MAIAKQAVTILAPTTVLANTTQAAPVAGSPVNLQVLQVAGGEWTYKIVNGTSAPTVAATMVLQTSHNGSDWYDYHMVGGASGPSGVSSGSVKMSEGVMYARAIAYGNATNAVTVESYLQAKVG